MVMTDPDTRRRWLSLALLLVIAVIAALTFRYAGDAASTTSALEESDKLAACRASHRVEVDDAQAHASVLFLRALVAATTDDDELLADLLTPSAAGVSKIDEAIDAIETASSSYAGAVELSRTDPDAFLAACEDRP